MCREPAVFVMVRPMPTTLRPAHPEDFDFCARPYFAGMEETIRQLKLDMAKQSANLRERWNVREVRIITSDGTDVGWTQSSTRDGALYLEQIFIDAAFQRRGIGTGIINDLIGRATQAGQPVMLGVVKTNPARHLYERLGFRVTHEDDRKFYMRREPGNPHSRLITNRLPTIKR
jgi:ribosomal protein S18 acetylase RimI-like enzyme